MGLVVVGMSHRTAPVALRERVAFTSAELPRALDELRRCAAEAEAVILSTCNRVEVVAFSDRDAGLAAGIERFLAAFHRVPRRRLGPHLYRLLGRDAIAHVFRVAASLDSMVPGESQILAQVKEAYQSAARAGATGKHLNALFQQALRAGKRVHAETDIARHKVSVSSVAVDLARETLGDLSRRTVLVLGAGETGKLALKSLVEAGVGAVVVTSRTAARSRSLAKALGGKAVPWKELGARLAEADLVLVSTASRDFLLSRETIANTMACRRECPLVVIDIAVPRNVDPAVAGVPGVRLFNIDDLERIVAENLGRRELELERGMRLVEADAARFAEWLETHGAEERIGRLIRRVTDASRSALDKLWERFPEIDVRHRRQIAGAVERSVRRSLHEPIEHLKKDARSSGKTS